MIPRRDQPGDNTALRPEDAPAWFDRLIGATRADASLGLRRRPQFSGQQSAVLLLFTGSQYAREVPADAGIVLTHRAHTLRAHPGQMSFPGGRMDAGDTDAVDTALREAWEETGVERNSVTPVAQLAATCVAHNAHPIHPVVGYWEEPGELYVASPSEVEDVFIASLAELTDPDTRFRVALSSFTTPAFRVRGYVVWGLTAMLLEATLTAAGWDQPWDDERVVELSDALAVSRNGERLVNR